MKTKIVKTILVLALWCIPIGILSKVQGISSKYLALSQFDNSELSFQLFQLASSNNFAPVVLASTLTALTFLFFIWKPKKPLA